MDKTNRSTFNTSNIHFFDWNQLYLEYMERQEFQGLVSIIVPVVYGCISFLGVIGNSLVIYTILSRGQKRSTIDILICILAFADLSFVIICIPFTAYYYSSTRWAFGDIGCKVIMYLIYVSVYVSVYTLVLMAFTRFLAIVHPLSSIPYRSKRCIFMYLSVLLIVTLAGNIPLLFLFGLDQVNLFGDEIIYCRFLYSELQQTFFIMFFIFGYAFPLIIICALYGLILKKILFFQRPGSQSGNRSIDLERLMAKKKVAKMVFVVVVVFAFCWLPDHIMFLTDFKLELDKVLLFVANCLAYVNSCINPILYGFMSTKFRARFKRALCTCTWRTTDDF